MKRGIRTPGRTRLMGLCVFNALLLFTRPQPSAAITLAREGKAEAAVIIRDNAPDYIVEAGRELVRYVEKISGAVLPIVAGPDEAEAPGRVWVGDHPEMAAHIEDLDLSFDHPEEILIALRGNDLVIMGRDVAIGEEEVEQGTERAVFEFLREPLGVRWLWPGELGEDIPRSTSISFQDFTRRHHPKVRQRKVRITSQNTPAMKDAWTRYWEDEHPDITRDVSALWERAETKEAETRQWQRRHHGWAEGQLYRYGSFHMIDGHAFERWYENYAEDHPEYFALQPDGTRNPFPRASRTKLCVSNPKVHARWIENAARTLEGSPSRRMVSASPNDSSRAGKCVCDACRAWDHPDGETYTYRWAGHEEAGPALTDRYVRFWNKLGRGLRERLPEREAFVGAWAYGPYRRPPIGIRLEDNIAIGFVGSFSTSPRSVWEEEREMWRGWAEKAPHLVWRPNLTWTPLRQAHIGLPLVFMDRFADDFAFLARHRMIGADISRFFNHWATQGPQYYQIMRLMWDPEQDAGELMDDYYRRGFGPAAAAIAGYFKVWEDTQAHAMDLVEGKHRSDMARMLPDIFTDEALAAAGAYLDQAAERVEGSDAVYVERVDFIRAGYEWIQAQVAVLRAMNAMQRGSGATGLSERVRQALAACEARNELIDALHDGYAIGTGDFLLWRANAGLKPYLGPVTEEYQVYLEFDEQRQIPLPTEWDFRLDPAGEGAEAGWYRPEHAARLDWGRLLVTAPWGQQLRPEDDDDPEMVEYHGKAWYRTAFHLEEGPREGETIWLRFGAVDESCWVYVNGAFVARQVFDFHDPDRDRLVWRKPRRFDITEYVAEGENELVVKVQALRGQGGITQPVRVERRPQNLVPNGYFLQGAEGWGTHLAQQHYERLEERVSSSLSHSRYVEEQSLVIRIAEDPEDEIGNIYASLGRMADQPLRAGALYELRVRLRQEPAERHLQPDSRPVRVRVYGRGDFPAERQDRFWFFSPPRQSEDWEEISGVFEAPRDYDRFSISLQFWYPGVYTVDEVVVRPL